MAQDQATFGIDLLGGDTTSTPGQSRCRSRRSGMWRLGRRYSGPVHVAATRYGSPARLATAHWGWRWRVGNLATQAATCWAATACLSRVSVCRLAVSPAPRWIYRTGWCRTWDIFAVRPTSQQRSTPHRSRYRRQREQPAGMATHLFDRRRRLRTSNGRPARPLRTPAASGPQGGHDGHADRPLFPGNATGHRA